jgi:subtilase family serine protease
VKVGADLIVSSLTLTSPTITGAGEPVVLTDTTKNQGAGAAPDSTTAFYLSLNSILDASDISLGSRQVAPLDAGETDTVSTTLTIPNGTPAGTYYIVANADANRMVGETIETNNLGLIPSIKVGPDLAVTATTGPATAVAGTQITVSDTTKNQGGGGTTSSTTSFYLSTNLSLDASDTQIGTRPVGPLGPGLTETASIAVGIPSGTPAGTYYIIAVADADHTIVERVETNNTLARSLRISAAP